MVWLRFWVRFSALVAMCVWMGGFMFYGGVVVSILDATLGRVEAGMITRDVTNDLNAIGGATVLLWWALAAIEWRQSSRCLNFSRAGALAASFFALAVLLILHVIMDRHLDTIGTRGFKPWHRVYLMVSTAQWLTNLATIALTVHIWTRGERSRVSFE